MLADIKTVLSRPGGAHDVDGHRQCPEIKVGDRSAADDAVLGAYVPVVQLYWPIATYA